MESDDLMGLIQYIINVAGLENTENVFQQICGRMKIFLVKMLEFSD